MPKTVGIVTEYNPFHLGHKYQIDKLCELGFDSIAVCMSGSCVQRGEFGLLSKFERAKMAVDCGVNLVCELPYPYSCFSAESFAKNGVRILKNLGVDAISFGSECGDIKTLYPISEYLLSNEYNEKLKSYLSSNIPFASAREKAILDKFSLNSNIVSASNDILALEYIKECIRLNWDVEFVPIKRKGANYNDLTPKNGVASATYIRKCADEFLFDKAVSFVPELIRKNFINKLEQGDYFTPDESFEKAIIFTLKKLSAQDFEKLPDCNKELSHAFENNISDCSSIEQLINSMPTKQYTRARLKRIILFAFLDYSDNLPELVPFIRVLAMDKKGEGILKKAKIISDLPISHSYRILQDLNDDCKNVIKAESFATDSQHLFFRYCGENRTDYTTKLYKK